MTATRYWSQSLITADSTTTTGFSGGVSVVLASEYDVLSAKLADAERDAQRWRNARRVANDISNPILRGIVTTFLDRFGTAVAADRPKAAHDNRTDVSVQADNRS